MKDAFGGLLNIFLIVTFLIIVSGILGLIVNYNKAFRMKNNILSIIEEYEGAKGCFEQGEIDSDCRRRIKESAAKYGYNPIELNCHEKTEDYKKSDGLFCYKQVLSESENHYIYKIITQVDINIPVINKILGFSIFQIHDDSRPLVKR